MKRIIITLCICTAWVASTYAQYPYTLKKCLEEGLAHNYFIRITRNEEQISHTYYFSQRFLLSSARRFIGSQHRSRWHQDC